MNRHASVWRACLVAIALGVAGASCVPPIRILAPVSGSLETTLPIVVRIDFSQSFDPSTFVATLDGEDITDAFTLTPEGNRIVAEAEVFIWEPLLDDVGHEIVASVEAPDGSLREAIRQVSTDLVANHVVSAIPTSEPVVAGLAVEAGRLFAAIGPTFRGAGQSIVRIDGAGETTLADGFNAVAGMAVDLVNDRLFVGDNGLEALGSETGDTLYAIPAPFDMPDPLPRALDLAVLAEGSIPFFSDLTLDPGDPTGDTLFVTEASLPGRVLRVLAAAGTVEVLQSSSLAFGAGVAATPTTLFFGDVFSPGTGRVSSVALPDGSGPRTTLIEALDGFFDLVLASDGSLLATVSAINGPSSIVRIDASSGAVLSVVATGLDFATGLAEEDGWIYAIEGGVAKPRVLVFAPLP